MKELEQIRANLVSASGYLNQILPYPPTELKAEIDAAWQRYLRLVQAAQMQNVAGGSENLGFLPLVIAGVVGLTALMGGSAYLVYELTESERLNKLTKCIANATQAGVPYRQAMEECNRLYGTGTTRKSFFENVGFGEIKNIMALGLLGLGGLFIFTKIWK